MSVETFFPETCLFNVSFNVNSAVSWHKPVITTHPERGVVSSKVTLLFYVCPRASAVFIWNITHVCKLRGAPKWVGSGGGGHRGQFGH